MRRAIKGTAIGVAVALLGAVLALTPLGTEFEEDIGLHWMFNLRGPVAPPDDIAVIAIDDRTGPRIGAPALLREWPRSIHGRLVDELVRRGASVIVFDVDFTRSRSEADERAFAEALARAGRVVLFQKLNGKRQPIFGADGRPTGTVWIEQLQSPVPPLSGAARALAPFPLPKQQEAVYEFWTFKSSAGDSPTMPAAALQVHALRVYDTWRKLLAAAGARGVESMPAEAQEIVGPKALHALMQSQREMFERDPGLGERVADAIRRAPGLEPADRRLLVALNGLYRGADHRYINFYGPPGTIRTIPYHAFLTPDPRVPPDALDVAGKVVFVGFSDLYDPGQPDRFYSVFTREDGVDLSGVEIATTAFGNLLTDSSVRALGAVLTALVLGAFGLLTGAAVYLLPALIGVPAVLAVAGLYAAGAQYAFGTAHLWLPLATPMLVQLPLALFVGLISQYLLERRQSRRFGEAVRLYLPETAVQELTSGGLDSASLNRIVYGTCFATDMAGFSTIAEAMSPRELAAFMNEYFDALAAPLKRNNVDVTEFHADTIMCAWIAPDQAPAADARSVTAALDVIDTIRQFGAARAPRPLHPRVGLDFGQFYLGNAGGGGRLAYSILGDTPNTAARLETLNKQLGTTLLATGRVAGACPDMVQRSLGRFQLVGRAEATEVVDIRGRSSVVNGAQVALCEAFAEALGLFAGRDWENAAQAFEAVLRRFPDDAPSRLYLDRSRAYLAAPPNLPDPCLIVLDSK